MAEQLQEGHPVSMFPAGGVSKYDFRNKRIKEQIWRLNNARIIKVAKLPVLPVMFSGQNSMKFYRLLRLSYNHNVLRLPSEILNKKGKVFDIYIGAPIQPEEYSKFKTLKELRDFLMQSSLALLPESINSHPIPYMNKSKRENIFYLGVVLLAVITIVILSTFL